MGGGGWKIPDHREVTRFEAHKNLFEVRRHILRGLQYFGCALLNLSRRIGCRCQNLPLEHPERQDFVVAVDPDSGKCHDGWRGHIVPTLQSCEESALMVSFEHSALPY